MINRAFFEGRNEELYNYLRAKKPEIHFDYDEIMHEAHHKAFTVAKITKLDLLKDIQESLAKAKLEGKSFSDFKKEITPILTKKGWLGEVEVTNPKTKEVKKIYVGNRRLKTIFYTNMTTANAKARYETQMLSSSQYFRYVAILDNLTRPEHSKYHNLVLPKNHPFWETHYPPNAWNCRCKVQVIDEDEIKKRGLEISKQAPKPFANKDWAYNVGKTDNLDSVLENKISKIEDKKFKDIVLQDYKDTNIDKEVSKKMLNSMIDEVIINQNQKYPINYIVVGSLVNTHLKAIKEYLKRDLEEGKIILSKKNLLHARPQRKERYNQAFKVEEMRQIVDILDNMDNAYLNTKDNNLVYVFYDKENQDKVNYVPIEILKSVKKFGGNSYILTLSKKHKEDFEADIKMGVLKKVKQ